MFHPTVLCWSVSVVLYLFAFSLYNMCVIKTVYDLLSLLLLFAICSLFSKCDACVVMCLCFLCVSSHAPLNYQTVHTAYGIQSVDVLQFFISLVAPNKMVVLCSVAMCLLGQRWEIRFVIFSAWLKVNVVLITWHARTGLAVI